LTSVQTVLLVHGDGVVGALVDAGPAIYTVRFIDHSYISDLDGRLGADILASSASNALVSVNLRNQI